MDVALIAKYLFEITVMWVIFYQLYRLFHRERAAMILGGLVVLSLLALAFIKIIDATELEVIGSALVPIGTILAILFQSEIRTKSLASIAASLPSAPIAAETSLSAMTGVSLMPSPT